MMPSDGLTFSSLFFLVLNLVINLLVLLTICISTGRVLYAFHVIKRDMILSDTNRNGLQAAKKEVKIAIILVASAFANMVWSIPEIVLTALDVVIRNTGPEAMVRASYGIGMSQSLSAVVRIILYNVCGTMFRREIVKIVRSVQNSLKCLVPCRQEQNADSGEPVPDPSPHRPVSRESTSINTASKSVSSSDEV